MIYGFLPLNCDLWLTNRGRASYAWEMADAHNQKGEPPEGDPRQRGVRSKQAVTANGVGQPLPSQPSSAPDRDPLPPGCPPADANDGPVHLFRMSKTKKPAPSDFRTAHESGTYLGSDPCRRRSLSSYTDRRDAESLRRRVRHFNDHQICEGTVPSGAGLHVATPTANEKSHCSWWPPQGIARHSFFSLAP